MQIRTAADAANLFRPLLPQDREELAVALLDADHRVLKLLSYAGTTDSVDLPLRDILGEALRLNARALVIAHNHPGGSPDPSAADLEATRRLAETCHAVGIALHDHLIFAGSDCTSMRSLGLL